MDYAVGSVAALISGNVTPNRPRLIRRALTPTKHQPSPNVTPKSEAVDDRSIFLSPSLQKKKAIVKKSPKRIFENPDLDITNDGDGSSVLLSPKADKVKKHLKDDLEADEKINMSPKSPKSPKKGKGKLDQSVENGISKKKISLSENDEGPNIAEIRNVNESTPKKKKKQKNSISMPVGDEKENTQTAEVNTDITKSSKKRKSQTATDEADENVNNNDNDITPKKKRKNKKSQSRETEIVSEEQTKPQEETQNLPKQKKKKRKRNKKGKNKANLESKPAALTTENQDSESTTKQLTPKKKKKAGNLVNPNAITNQDSDSEHESDDEIQSETEQTNNQILDTGPVETSDEEGDDDKTQKQEKKEKKERIQGDIADDIKRTLFIGNVPFSEKCKKEIKRIFSKYGEIETVRIRTVPVKDARFTPKLAVIKNELHPDRSTVNVYVRFRDESSVSQALAENNTVLNNNHLRVTRSDSTGVEHDPHKAIFVGNLPFAIEDDTLRAKFERCGEIVAVRVVRDNKTNAGKGFGYVNFASKDGVELALAMSEEDLTIKNRILRVKRCTFTNKKSGNQASGSQRNEKFQGGKSQGMKEKSQGRYSSFGRNQGGNFRGQGFGRNQDRSQSGFGNQDRFQGQDGAHRRLLKKRQYEESGGSGGPPNKRPNITQPVREKKPRKEFVGMTAEKKKKHKFNKGDKKKKALSEILTKYS